MSKQVGNAEAELLHFYETHYCNALDYEIDLTKANLIADLAVARTIAKLNQPRLGGETIDIDVRNHTTPEAIEQAARDTVERAAPRFKVGHVGPDPLEQFKRPFGKITPRDPFKAELSKSLDELRDAAFALIVALKDRQDAKRGAK